MSEKKYASLSSLSTFLDNIKNIFATKTEVDTTLSSAKTYSDIGDTTTLETSQLYTDTAVSQKSQVQIITPENTESLSTLQIYKLTQEEYDDKVASGDIDETALYLTPNEKIDLSVYATVEQLNAKSDIEHTHKISDVTNLQSSLDEKVSVSRTINGKALTTDITFSASDIGADVSGSADIALSEARAYADNIKNDLLNGAGAAYDTLKELGDLIDDNTNAIEALETIASGKADAAHTHDDIYYTKTEMDEKVSTINESISSSVTETKSYANVGDTTTLETARTYTANAVAQKSQVQIIIWEADD